MGGDISPDGKLLALGGYAGSVEVFDWKTGRAILAFRDHARRVYDVRFSSDGRFLATADYDLGLVMVHELAAELAKKPFDGPYV